MKYVYKLIRELQNVPSDDLIRYNQLIEKYEETIYDKPGVKNKLQSIIKNELEKRSKK